jgi:hypothetical protein
MGPEAHSSHPHNLYWVSFLDVKQMMHGIDCSPTYSAKVKERAELHLYPYLGLHGLF